MRTSQRFIFAGTALFGAIALYGCAASPDRQENLADMPSIKPIALKDELGREDIAGRKYSIRASRPIKEKRPIDPKGPSDEIQLLSSGVTAPYGVLTRIFTIRTGSQRTVAYMCGRIHGIFQKFLAGPAPHTEIDSVGDARRGGDGVRFIAVSPDVFQYDTYTPKSEAAQSITLTKADIEAFDRILVKALAEGR